MNFYLDLSQFFVVCFFSFKLARPFGQSQDSVFTTKQSVYKNKNQSETVKVLHDTFQSERMNTWTVQNTIKSDQFDDLWAFCCSLFCTATC